MGPEGTFNPTTNPVTSQAQLVAQQQQFFDQNVQSTTEFNRSVQEFTNAITLSNAETQLNNQLNNTIEQAVQGATR